MLLMGTMEREGRQIVVELTFFPTGGSMAGLAGLFRVVFGRDFSDMDIVMAIYAALFYIPKNPFFFFSVTGKARGRFVCPCERKFRLAMHFQSV